MNFLPANGFVTFYFFHFFFVSVCVCYINWQTGSMREGEKERRKTRDISILTLKRCGCRVVAELLYFILMCITKGVFHITPTV